KARAVLVLWTKNSITSDWVRAEAGRAKADRKLIPIKTSEVNYKDIPLPFGEMHTENLGSSELIRAAVVSLLARPGIKIPPWFAAFAGARYAFLTWFGIIGGIITLFTSLKGLLHLADWIYFLASKWTDWTHSIWEFILSTFGFQAIPKIFTPILTFFV